MKNKTLKIILALGLTSFSLLAIAEGRYVVKFPLSGVQATPTFGMNETDKQAYEYENNLNKSIASLSYSSIIYNTILDRCETNIAVKTDDPNMSVQLNSNDGFFEQNNINTNSNGLAQTLFSTNINIASISATLQNNWDSKSLNIDFTNCINEKNQINTYKEMCSQEGYVENKEWSFDQIRYVKTSSYVKDTIAAFVWKEADTIIIYAGTDIGGQGDRPATINSFVYGTTTNDILDGDAGMYLEPNIEYRVRAYTNNGPSGENSNTWHYPLYIEKAKTTLEKSENYDWCVSNGYETAN